MLAKRPALGYLNHTNGLKSLEALVLTIALFAAVTASCAAVDPEFVSSIEPPRVLAEVLHPESDRFVFTFTTPNPAAPHKTRFRYRLAGLEDDWIPGDYTLLVQAAVGSSDWVETAADFHLHPLYYQTRGFKVLMFLGFMTLFGLVYQLRVAAMRRRQVNLERVIACVLANISHPKLKLSRLRKGIWVTLGEPRARRRRPILSYPD